MYPQNIQIEDVILPFSTHLIQFYEKQYPDQNFTASLNTLFKNTTIVLDFAKNNIFSLFISCLQKLNKHDVNALPLIQKQIEMLSNIQMAQFFQISETFMTNDISEVSAKEMAKRIENMDKQEMETIFGPEDDFEEKEMISSCLNIWSE
ncbi:hypothetical protein SS50377_25726 [Spironucleus salmonicida]|uniref:Uncharacterized protein n=1 Tax=Spironucleus salmonicida TaxID=348837 RepID=A0A9P8LNT8_9EUKA|nr:hypothetical protein SS50377_25726 [Spironucleus salmonicida]